MKLKIPDIFTYEDALSGKRKTRAYVNVTLFVVAALIIFMALALYQQAQESREMAATKTIALFPTDTPTAEPTAAVEGCPSDPTDWTLGDIFENDVRKAITPACVYDGLAHSVAWALAIQEGYSRQAAADALGFTDFPMAQVTEVTIADNRQGHKTMKVHFVPPAPNFTEWYINGDGKPTVSFSVRGCYRTFAIVGNLKQEWQPGYPVICEVAMDVEAVNMVMCLDNHCFASPYSPTRYYGLYGYNDSHNWIWLGNETDTRVDGIQSQQVQEDRSDMMLSHGQSASWDSTWLTENFQLENQPLPENWQTLTNNDDLQAIVTSLNAGLAGGINP